MKNKNNITIIKTHIPKVKKAELPNIEFAPVYGGLKGDIFKRSKGFSDIVIVDVGPSFHNINDTLDVLDKIKTYPMRQFKWIDHHKWPQSIITKYREYLKISDQTESCAELIERDYIESLSRTIIFYGADCDGIISAALVAMGNKISTEARNELIKIARACDTACFFNNKMAMVLHKAVYMARLTDDSNVELNMILQEIIEWALSGMNNSKKYFVTTFKLMAKYDETVIPINNKIINNPLFNTDDIKVFNTAHIQYADLSYVCSYLYQIKTKYVLFVNSSGISINSKASNIDLTKEFDAVGIKHKIFIQQRRVELRDLFDIILKLERI